MNIFIAFLGFYTNDSKSFDTLASSRRSFSNNKLDENGEPPAQKTVINRQTFDKSTTRTIPSNNRIDKNKQDYAKPEEQPTVTALIETFLTQPELTSQNPPVVEEAKQSVNPEDDQAGSTEYEVRIKVANQRGLQTADGILRFNMYGENGNIENLLLEKKHNDSFKTNRLDIFTFINLKDIGKVTPRTLVFISSKTLMIEIIIF